MIGADGLHGHARPDRQGARRPEPAGGHDDGPHPRRVHTFVLDLTPEDAELTVFATGAATLYLGLLPPENKDGYAEPGTVGVPFAKVVGVAK